MMSTLPTTHVCPKSDDSCRSIPEDRCGRESCGRERSRIQGDELKAMSAPLQARRRRTPGSQTGPALMLPSVAFSPVLQQPDRLSRRRPQPRPRTSGEPQMSRRARSGRVMPAQPRPWSAGSCVRDARRRAVPLDLYLVVHAKRDEVQAVAPCA
eukprot:COSAG02_NODE_463_length_21833_cov_11.529539_18_plen_154_part_00